MGWLTYEKLKNVANILGFMDKAGNRAKYYDKAQRNGIPVWTYPIKEHSKEIEWDADIVVLVCVCMKSAAFELLKEELNNDGFKNVYYSRFYQYENVSINDLPAIQTVYGLLQDVESKAIFCDLLKAGGTYQNIGNRIWETMEASQYFPDDICLNKGYSRFVDCGAYIGDTIQRVVNRGNVVEKCWEFEPSVSNYEKLQETLSDLDIENKMAYSYAVGAERTLTCFSDDMDASCCLDENGSREVQIVPLDDFIGDMDPTFIKMDIEGAEAEALRGARQIIEKYEPDLAICVYHKFSHLWDICVYIHEICPKYKFYLRCYGFEGGETVLYATV